MNNHDPAHQHTSTLLRLPRWLRNILFGAIFAWALTTALYVFRFHDELSSKQDVWGQFGDFLGGTLNPMFAFMTFIALLYTIVLQGEQVRHAEQALKVTEHQLHLQAQDSRKQLTASVLLELRQIYSTDEMNRAVHYIGQLRRSSAAEFQENRYAFARRYIQGINPVSAEWAMRRKVSHFYSDVAALIEADCLNVDDLFTSYGTSFEVIEFLEPIEVAIAEELNAMPYEQAWVALRLLARGREWQREQLQKGVDPRFKLPRDPELYERSRL
jgi:hypothetical protein